jgi:hypothetical protein
MNIVITILLASVKYAMTFPLAILEFKFSYFETILWMNVGGLLGIYFFAFISEGLIRWIKDLISRRKRKLGIVEKSKKKMKIFTKRNRRIIRIKQKYGLIGIAFTTPLLLSIPVGVFLAVRYYPRSRTKYIYLIGSNIVWSFIYTSFYMFWNDLLLK